MDFPKGKNNIVSMTGTKKTKLKFLFKKIKLSSQVGQHQKSALLKEACRAM